MTVHFITPNSRYRNAFNGETFIFTAPAGNTDNTEFGLELEPGGSGGGNALLHVHPNADEHFVVRRGKLKITIGNEVIFAEPGKDAVVPKGKPHCFANDHDGVTEATVRFMPGERHLQFFLNFAKIVESRPEWFGRKGEPPLLLMALVFHAYRGHMYLSGPPIWLQKLLFAALAPVARWRGYSLAVRPSDVIQAAAESDPALQLRSA